MIHYKLQFEEEAEDPFYLIAIHCSEEAYKMAFLLNKSLSISLKRKRSDLTFWKQEMASIFPIFEFEKEQQYTQHYLVGNKSSSKMAPLQNTQNLFALETQERTVTTHLLPEFKKVDFFLKIESDVDLYPVKKILAQINEIKEVISAYIVEHENIKTHHNLIFS